MCFQLFGTQNNGICIQTAIKVTLCAKFFVVNNSNFTAAKEKHFFGIK